MPHEGERHDENDGRGADLVPELLEMDPDLAEVLEAAPPDEVLRARERRETAEEPPPPPAPPPAPPPPAPPPASEEIEFRPTWEGLDTSRKVGREEPRLEDLAPDLFDALHGSTPSPPVPATRPPEAPSSPRAELPVPTPRPTTKPVGGTPTRSGEAGMFRLRTAPPPPSIPLPPVGTHARLLRPEATRAPAPCGLHAAAATAEPPDGRHASPCPGPLPAAPAAPRYPLLARVPRGPLARQVLTAVATILVVGALVAGLLLTNPRSDSASPTSDQAPTTTGQPSAPARAAETIVAQARIPVVEVFAGPEAPTPIEALDHPTALDSPLVFVVIETRDAWLHVQLPVPPVGSTGWVRESDVRLTKHGYRVTVDLGDRRLLVLDGSEVLLDAPIAVGARGAPEPGTYYIKELLRTPGPDSVYGPSVFGLSGYINAPASPEDTLVGIHGTNDESVIGQEVVEGSIRLSNEDLDRLVGTLPLGTPVEVTR